jgi:hypothetical protein
MAAGLAGQQTQANSASTEAINAGQAAQTDAATARGLSKFADNVEEH